MSTLGFGLTYLLLGQFMPYHGVAFEHEWDVLPHALQTLALALMRAAAGGALANALRCDPADTLSSESGLGVLDAAREYLDTFFVRVIGGRLATA